MRLVDPAMLPGTRWRNGAGLTRELATGPEWRLSLADIDGAADYSAFPGLRRWSCVVGGAGLRLTLDGVAQDVKPGAVVEYDGETPAHAQPLVAGEVVKNLNLMVRRPTRAGLVPVRIAGRHVSDAVAVYVLSGRVTLPGGPDAPAGTVVLDPGELTGTAQLIEAWVAP